MEEKRHVSKMQSVFDLSHCGVPNITDGTSGRVMFIYDEKENLKEFILLNGGIPENVRNEIISWLEENIDVGNDVWNKNLNDSDLFV